MASRTIPANKSGITHNCSVRRVTGVIHKKRLSFMNWCLLVCHCKVRFLSGKNEINCFCVLCFSWNIFIPWLYKWTTLSHTKTKIHPLHFNFHCSIIKQISKVACKSDFLALILLRFKSITSLSFIYFSKLIRSISRDSFSHRNKQTVCTLLSGNHDSSLYNCMLLYDLKYSKCNLNLE